jgi:hypothetical protein
MGIDTPAASLHSLGHVISRAVHLRHLVRGFLIHYITGRYHQGIGSRVIRQMVSPSNDTAPVGAIKMPVPSRRSAQPLLP